MTSRFTLLLLILSTPLCSPADERPSRQQQQAEMAKLRMQAEPGDEHAQLKTLAGQWSVAMKVGEKDMNFNGTASTSMILGDRFLVIDGRGKPANRDVGFRYTIGFDRRHNEYVIIAMDTTGTYPVSGRGKPAGQVIRVFGTDDDPHMKKLGFEKKFAFDLEIRNADSFSLSTLWVDTRTKEEKLNTAFEYVFTRRRDAE